VSCFREFEPISPSRNFYRPSSIMLWAAYPTMC